MLLLQIVKVDIKEIGEEEAQSKEKILEELILLSLSRKLLSNNQSSDTKILLQPDSSTKEFLPT